MKRMLSLILAALMLLILAACGSGAETPAVTEPEEAEAAAPAAEEAPETEETPADTATGEYTIEATENEAGVPFTANDVLACGILSEGKEEQEFFRPLVEEVVSGNAAAEISFSNSSVKYVMEDGLFTALTTVAEGREVSYSFKYENGLIQSMTADFGGGDVSEVSFTNDGVDATGLTISGYGGEQNTSVPGERLAVDRDRGGFVCYIGGNLVNFALGTIGQDDSALDVSMQLDPGGGDGFDIWEFNINGRTDGTWYKLHCYEGSPFVPEDAASSVLRRLNGTDCYIARRIISENAEPVDSVLTVFDITPESLLYIEYKFNQGSFVSGVTSDMSFEFVYVDADGNVLEDTADVPADYAPDVVFSAEDYLTGEELTSGCFAQYDLTMVNFWEPWCPPCVGEMPDLQSIYEQLGDQGVSFSIIGVFGTEEGAEDVLRNIGTGYPVIMYQEAFRELSGYHTGAVPTTVFFDRDGHVMESSRADREGIFFVGSRSREGWLAVIEELLGS